MNGTLPVLVTGANGFIGSHLVDELLRRGFPVRALVRRSSDLTWLNPEAERAVGDVTVLSSLPEALRGIGAIYHVAGLTGSYREADYADVNVGGARNLLLAARKAAPDLERFVLISSLAAAGPSRDGIPVRERDRPRPVCAYGLSKLGGERAAFALGDAVPVTVIRPPMVYGPRDHDFLTVYKMVAGGRALTFLREKYYSIVHVHDLVRGIALAGTSDAGRDRVYHVAGSRGWSLSAILERVADSLGLPLRRARVPETLFRLVGPVVDVVAPLLGAKVRPLREKVRQVQADYWVADTDRARRELGFEAEEGLTEGLCSTAEFYRQRGWIA